MFLVPYRVYVTIFGVIGVVFFFFLIEGYYDAFYCMCNYYLEFNFFLLYLDDIIYLRDLLLVVNNDCETVLRFI